MKARNKYTRLLSNTALFGISTFSSKVLSFVLTRLYTTVLTEASYGIVDLITACANLLIPLVSLGIATAVIRFGLERDISKPSVFTNGFAAIGIGFSVLLLASPFIAKMPSVRDQMLLLYLYVLMSCLRTLCCQFTRANLYTRLYAIDGILSTVYTVLFNVLFLVVFKLGTTGYLLSIICADFCSIVFLMLVGRLWPDLQFSSFNKKLFVEMLRYALPLVPAMMFWWVTNASDRFFIFYMRGPAENGLYAAAAKVPSIVAVFSTIFTEAWQVSAVTDGQGAGQARFFSRVFSALSGIVFVGGAALILLCKPIMHLLVAPDFFISWQFVPFLILATVFSCLVAFLNSVYMLHKKSGHALVTMLIGAALNLLLNAYLIPDYGPNGAAYATFLSYLLVFLIRAVDSHDMIAIDYKLFSLLASAVLLLAEAFVMVTQPPLWQLWCTIMTLGLFLLHFNTLYSSVRQLFARKSGKAAPGEG